MFTKILIANRGEIACRVIATARKMGIKTVAVYSDADKEARHVKLADEAVHIGAAPSRESYLLADKIIAACKQTGAQAVHPGYGFLSENEAFAKRCEDEGIAFIGPKAHSIAAMGDKIASKKLANEAKVNTIPGYNDAIVGPEQAVEIAKGIGYPVMIKASAGGGGKGLRVAFNDKEAFEGFASCQNEARNSFGDDRIFIEKFVQEPRHIEIQVLGDSHGNVIHLGERDCSIQRRHQKVIEEAPAPGITQAEREAIGQACVDACKRIGYRGAGTFEFLYENGEFFFIEMNTRVQVEHPVTELISGVDIVQEQIRVASGLPLQYAQEDIILEGHAFECRINAEDPYNFIPSPGLIESCHLPGGFGVRVDSHIYQGYRIPPNYDSLIGKICVHGKTREQAMAKMRVAMAELAITGIKTNTALHRDLFADPGFQEGGVSIHYLEKWLEEKKAKKAAE